MRNDRKDKLMGEKKIMLGNAAIARGAYEAGVKVSAAYPGTPSTTINAYLKIVTIYKAGIKAITIGINPTPEGKWI